MNVPTYTYRKLLVERVLASPCKMKQTTFRSLSDSRDLVHVFENEGLVHQVKFCLELGEELLLIETFKCI